MNIPFEKNTVADVLKEMHIARAGDATIRQTVAIAEELEKITGQKFIHLEMGSPGLPPSQIGIEAQKKALDSGVASKYPNISGIEPLKKQASRFIKAFLDIDVDPEGAYGRFNDGNLRIIYRHHASESGEGHDTVHRPGILRAAAAG